MKKKTNNTGEYLLRKLGKRNVKINESIAPHTTFRVGGPADFFFEAKTKNELIGVLRAARKERLPFLLIGSGSNLLVADGGFRGLVIKVNNTKFKVQKEKPFSKIIVGAGMKLSELVEVAVARELTGLEFAVGIPGTVGGAVRGNAGAWQQSIGDLVSSVKILNQINEIETLRREECRFSYRNSRFKHTNEVILEVNLLLRKGDKRKIASMIETNREKRSDQPKEFSAGCVFVNPKLNAAGELIDQCGLKGRVVGGAQISPKHANFIVNLGKAKADDIIALMNLAKKEVKKKFGIELKEEICLVGFD